jgi:hypothetical protein
VEPGVWLPDTTGAGDTGAAGAAEDAGAGAGAAADVGTAAGALVGAAVGDAGLPGATVTKTPPPLAGAVLAGDAGAGTGAAAAPQFPASPPKCDAAPGLSMEDPGCGNWMSKPSRVPQASLPMFLIFAVNIFGRALNAF